MAEIEDGTLNMAFDPTSKKKKKKVKKLADFEDESTTTDEPAAAAAATAADEAAFADDSMMGEGAAAAPVRSAEDIATLEECLSAAKRVTPLWDDNRITLFASEDFDFQNTKKRKRLPQEAVDQVTDLLSEFSLDAKKKKKKKVKKALLEGEDSADRSESGEAPAASGLGSEEVSEDDNREFTYKEMLDRLFAIMRAANPDYASGDRKRFVMKPPQVSRIGSKKTAFVNFLEICKLLHRERDHVLAFLCAELGTSGSLDSSNCLVIKGRFNQKNIENVLRKYIRDYVTCHTCKSPNTILTKHARLYFLQCETCGSRCSVASIKSGFQALTTKRSAARAKAQ